MFGITTRKIIAGTEDCYHCRLWMKMMSTVKVSVSTNENETRQFIYSLNTNIKHFCDS